MKPMGVRSAFAREILLLGTASLMCATSIVCMVLSLSSNEWLRVSSEKAPFPGAPWLSFDLGLTGGVATMHQQIFKRESWSSVGFKYADSSKYCPDGQCEALYYAGIVAIVLMSLAVGACFAAMIIEVTVMLQLGNVFVERGPFGPYVNYQRCWRNCVAASVSSSLGFAFSVAASASWGGIMFEHQSNIPDFHGGGEVSSHIEWHLGWVWALNIIVPLLMVGATAVVSCTAKMSSHPFTGYSSIV